MAHVAYFEGLNKHVANIVVVLRPSERLCGPVNVRQVVVAAVPVGTARVCVNHVFDGFTQFFHVGFIIDWSTICYAEDHRFFPFTLDFDCEEFCILGIADDGD